ncbi:MAG: hypothetical protein PHF72_07415 [Gammaproteobacteria bacterium]|nr:hypothetical protein [Gammaproteobacteria bacterium]
MLDLGHGLLPAGLLITPAAWVAQGHEHGAHDGVLRVIRTLENYGSYFDHPGWSGLDRH